MAETNATATGTEQKPIHVNLSKLREGIGTVFSGVLVMLEALDTETAKRLVEGFVREDNGKEEQVDEVKPSESGTLDSADTVSHDAPAVDDDVSGEMTDQQKAPEVSVTQDDITKIIVQKLKKDRTNNERIGAILRTYGVARVSDLPANRYVAFLTDLSLLLDGGTAMPVVHALFSASSSKQWLHCPPSVRLQEGFPNESSVYAEEGTLDRKSVV